MVQEKAGGDITPDFEKMCRMLESEMEIKLEDGPKANTLKYSGGNTEKLKKQGGIMAELSPYFAFHFGLLRDQERPH